MLGMESEKHRAKLLQPFSQHIMNQEGCAYNTGFDCRYLSIDCKQTLISPLQGDKNMKHFFFINEVSTKWMNRPSVTEMDRGAVYEMDNRQSAKKMEMPDNG